MSRPDSLLTTTQHNKILHCRRRSLPRRRMLHRLSLTYRTRQIGPSILPTYFLHLHHSPFRRRPTTNRMAPLCQRRIRSSALDLDNLETGFAGVGEHRKETNLAGLEQKPVDREHKRAV